MQLGPGAYIGGPLARDPGFIPLVARSSSISWIGIFAAAFSFPSSLTSSRTFGRQLCHLILPQVAAPK